MVDSDDAVGQRLAVGQLHRELGADIHGGRIDCYASPTADTDDADALRVNAFLHREETIFSWKPSWPHGCRTPSPVGFRQSIELFAAVWIDL